MEITITREALKTARYEGSVVALEGTEPETGDRVLFAGDVRPVVDVLDVIAREGEATVDVEPWQVLSRTEVTA